MLQPYKDILLAKNRPCQDFRLDRCVSLGVEKQLTLCYTSHNIGICTGAHLFKSLDKCDASKWYRGPATTSPRHA